MRLNFFDKLSKFTLVEVLSEWLDVEAFVFLDSALCSTKSRTVFLSLISEFHRVFETSFFGTSYPLLYNVIEWISSRGMQVSSLEKCLLSPHFVRRWRWGGIRHQNAIHAVSKVLTSIEMVGFPLLKSSNFTVCEILGRFSCLTTVRLFECHDPARLLLSITSSLLTSLHIVECGGLDDIKPLLSRQMGLKELCIHNTNTYYCLPDLRCKLTSLLIVRCSVHFGQCNAEESWPYYDHTGVVRYSGGGMMGDVVSRLLLTSAHSLTSACFYRPNELSHDSIKALVTACPLLTSLVFNACGSMSEESLTVIAHHLPGLKEIGLNMIDVLSDPGVATLLRGCRLLESVSIRCKSSSVSPETLRLLLGCGALRKLALTTDSATSTVLYAILSSCPRLHDLTVNNWGKELVLGVHCGQLTQLKLTNCLLNDKSLRNILRHCTNLTRLSLDSCGTITGISLVAAVYHCPRLKVLACSQYPTNRHARAMKDIRGVRTNLWLDTENFSCLLDDIGDYVDITSSNLFVQKPGSIGVWLTEQIDGDPRVVQRPVVQTSKQCCIS